MKLPEVKKAALKKSYTSFSPDESFSPKIGFHKNINNLDSFQLDPRSTENTPLMRESPLLSLAGRNNIFLSKRIRRRNNKKKVLSFTKLSTDELMYDVETGDPSKTHQILEKLQKSDLLARITSLRSGSIRLCPSNSSQTFINQNNFFNLLDQGFRPRSCHCSKCGVNKKAEMLNMMTLRKRKPKAVVNIKKKAKIVAPDTTPSNRSMMARRLKMMGRSSTMLITYSEDKDKKEKEKKEKDHFSKNQYTSQINNSNNSRKNSKIEKIDESVKKEAQKTEKVFKTFAKSNFSTSSHRSENSTNFLTSRIFITTKKDKDSNSSLTSRIYFTNKKNNEKSELSINKLFFNNSSKQNHKKIKENNEKSSINEVFFDNKDYETYKLVAMNGGKRAKSLFKIVTRMGTTKTEFESPFSNSYAKFWRKEEEVKRNLIKN